jgi:hypothetical protein
MLVGMRRRLVGLLLACGSCGVGAAAPILCTTARWEQTARLGRSAPLLAVNSSACMCAAAGRVPTLFAGVRRAADATGARITSRRCQFDYARNTLAAVGLQPGFNDDWPHCVGEHELQLGLQMQHQAPVRLRAVQRAVDELNTLGLIIGLAGAPGSGKTSLQGLAVHYGARMMELEDTGGGKSNLTLQNKRLAFNHVVQQQRALNAAATKGATSPSGRPVGRKAILVGLTGSMPVYEAAPAAMIKVLLLPSREAYERRWKLRALAAKLLVHQHQQKRGWVDTKREFQLVTPLHENASANFDALRPNFDVVIESDGCAEQSLVDLSTGVVQWLHRAKLHASVPSSCHAGHCLLSRPRWTQIQELTADGTEAEDDMLDAKSRFLPEKDVRPNPCDARGSHAAAVSPLQAPPVAQSSHSGNGQPSGRFSVHIGANCFVDVIMLWPTVYAWWGEIASVIDRMPNVSIVGSTTHRVKTWGFFLRAVYAVDDVSTTYVDAKIHFFEEWAMTHPADEAMVVRVLWARIASPRFRPKTVKSTKLYKKPTSLNIQQLKLQIRTEYKARVANYQFDVVIHAGDNGEHARHVERLIGRTHAATAACDARAWLLHETADALTHRYTNLSVAVIVGSFAFDIAGMDLGRPVGDIDLAVGAHGRRVSRLPPVQKGPKQLSTNVQLMGTGPWLPFGNVTDDDLAAQARYHVVTFPHGIKVARPELAYLKKCVAYRAKDVVDLRALHTQFAQQGAYHERDLQANKSKLIGHVLWDWKFLREMAQRIAQNPRAAKLIKQRCPLTET